MNTISSNNQATAKFFVRNYTKIKLFLLISFTILVSLFVFSNLAFAKKIVIINDNITVDTKEYEKEEDFSFIPYNNESEQNLSKDSEGFLIITKNTDLEKIQRKISSAKVSSLSYKFTQNIVDSSLLEQRSVSECKTIINETISKIPSQQLNGLKTINLIYEKNANRGGANATNMHIRCNDISDSELKAVVVHELGHIVDGSYLKGVSKEKSEFLDLGNPVKIDDKSLDFYQISWENDKTKVKGSLDGDFCSLYGKTDPYEDFAECYIMFVMQPSQFEKNAEKNTQLQKKLDFIKNIVFKGKFVTENSDLFLNKSIVYDNTKLSHSF